MIAVSDSVQIVTLIIAAVSPVLSAVTYLLISKVKDDVHRIEKATNSMKDALVKATGDAAHAQGMADQRAATAPNKET